ncbi:ABC transporter permease [Halalkalicoccus jeotgali]|uniref:Sugar ABC transporter membrane protein n=1 Tax=Halalkalicoccus jeotgali (strain DSM 18796 / CECT 7217 / JCM 14584 / KCTC 4019 / B3) TaxID=795797 RepID=D8JCN4_HALJB|nr:ABC transporter permease [Halalkalicoccus jeotgali]ADJ17141.1 sugar ABC transporter membrane protein [Halalkalicoccus jeotgali B3]ELY41704.1 sugar ABC transporter membrane protein [Halalkalicoccus jeotgali B3]
MSSQNIEVFDRVLNLGQLSWRDHIVLVSLLALMGLFSLTSSYFLTIENLLNIARQTAVVAVLGVGLTMVIISAEIDVSVGSVMALSAVLAAMALNAGFGWIGAVVVALGVGTIVGLTNGFFTVYFGIPSFLVTLGMLAAARGAALIVTGTETIVVRDPGFFNVFAGSIGPIPAIVIWAGLAVVLVHYVLSYTRFGRHIYTTGDDSQAARYNGIDTAKVKLTTLGVTGTLAGFAGLLMIGRLSAARPDMGMGIELAVIAAVILGGTSLFGGRGWVTGTIIGALLLSVIDNGLLLHGFGTSHQEFFRGIVIILAVALRAEEQSGEWL